MTKRFRTSPLVALAAAAMGCVNPWSGSLPAHAAPAETTPVFRADWVVTPKVDTVVGGAEASAVFVQGNPALLQRVVLRPEDVRDASLSVTLQSPSSAVRERSMQLRAHRALRPLDTQGRFDAGRDYEAEPIAAVSLEEASGKQPVVELTGFADLAREWAASPESAYGLVLTLGGDRGDEADLPKLTIKDWGVAGKLAVASHPKHSLFENPLRPRDGVFAQVRDGKLYYGEQRLRLWGVVGYPDVERLVNMGFNAQRVWQPASRVMYDEASAKRGELKAYRKGDGSDWDNANRHMAELREAGCFVMLGGLQDTIDIKWVAVDGSFVSGGDDWQEWKEAVLSFAKPHDYVRGPLFFDERLQAIKKRHARNLLTHVNPYTGNAYGQEEAIVIYEVFNENGGVKRILEGSYEKWPAYFQQKFQRKWNAWLKERYRSDAALKKAWGELGDGESLAKSSVAAGPKLGDRSKHPEARGDDFVRFVVEMIDGFHQEFRDYCRSLAPEGVGVNVAPFSFDTHYRPNLAWNYLQSRGDVNSPGMYFWNLESQLDQPPAAYVIDSNTVEGAATVLYETNSARPSKFRAEYPLKLAALANWQDWDGVFWHYWHRGGDDIDEAYLALPLKNVNKHHYWNGVHHESDPVMCSAMALAGRMFLGFHSSAASNPDIIEVGGEGIFSYDHYNGIGQAQRTFSKGSRVRYVPQKRTGASLNGGPLPKNERVTGAVAMGQEVVWDWPNGRLIVDTPTAKGYAGRVSGAYRFKDGITLDEVSTPSVAFYMVSMDGKPLAGPDASKRVYIAAVANAMNTGFDFDWNVRGGPMEQAAAVKDPGRAPVLVDEVGFTLYLPHEASGRLIGYDFALRQAAEQTIGGTNVMRVQGRTMFMNVLEIEAYGDESDTPATTLAIAYDGRNGVGSTSHSESNVASDGRWHPLPGVTWSMDYHQAHRTLRDASYVFTSITSEDFGTTGNKAITVTDAEVPTLWSALADLEVIFDGGRMTEVVITFKQPPAFEDVLAAYASEFGPPVERVIGTQYERSLGRWHATRDRPAVTATESQGVLKILYSPPRSN